MDVEKINRRIVSVDLLRGVVMIIMVLDHVREFVCADSFLYSPTDLSKTNPEIFFTRWITHFCAPVFVFLSGVSIYLQLMKGKSRRELAAFLLKRGVWLIVLEFTVIRLALFFSFDYSLLGIAEVIWIFGVSMIILAGVIYLPLRVTAVLAVLMIVGHNLLDAYSVPPSISTPTVLQSLWLILHQNGRIPLFGGVTQVFISYPLIPWVGLMALGYVFGSTFAWEQERRRKLFLIAGGAAVLLFIILRAINVYGDPQPWSVQATPLFTFLSFLNTTKYPASLLFILMTIGPALLFLYAADRAEGKGWAARIVIVFGSVPLFYFILQMFYAHAAGVVLGYLNGFDMGFSFSNQPFGGPASAGFGFSLATTYAVWLTGLVLLYPICLMYGRLKRRSGHWLFSYL